MSISASPHTHSRGRSASLTLPEPIPLSSRPCNPSSAASPPPALSSSPQPPSALSASLKAFQDLSLSPDRPAPNGNPLDTHEFRQAFAHARRTSFGNSTATKDQLVRPIVIPDAPAVDLPTPGLSTSPSSEATSGSLPTPSSSPTSTSTALSPPANGNSKARTVSNGSTASGKVGKASSTLGGVCEKDELAMERGELVLTDEDLATPPAASTGTSSLSGSGIFAGGARWGWPAGATSPPTSANSGAIPLASPISPPAGPSSVSDTFQRRGSLAFASPPSTSGFRAPGSSSPSSSGLAGPSSPPAQDPFRMMQPLGRVVSAGAALQTPNSASNGTGSGGGGPGGGGGGGGKEGFSIFRRFSISGLGKTRPSAPAPPPPAAVPAPTLAPPVVLCTSPAASPSPMPSSAAAGAAKSPLERGRSLGAAQGAKAKRRISPMGEKILRGGY